MESFGKVISFLLVGIILFLAPAYYMSLKQDMITQNYVNKEVFDFVNITRNTGKMTKDSYMRFIKKLDVTGNKYEIQIEYYDDDIYVPEDDILKEIFENGTYRFQKGDYISIAVQSKNKTLAMKLQEFFFQSEIKNPIRAVFGGVIRDEVK